MLQPFTAAAGCRLGSFGSGDAQACSEVQAAGTNTASRSARQAEAVGTLVLDADKIADPDLKSAAERLSSDIRGNRTAEAKSVLQALSSRCDSLGLIPR